MKGVSLVVKNGILSHFKNATQVRAAPTRISFAVRPRAVQYSESHSGKAKIVFGRVHADKAEGCKRPSVVHTCF